MAEEQDLIDKLGGVASVAADMTKMTGEDVSPGRVYQWRRQGYPKGFRETLRELCKRRRVKVPDELKPLHERRKANADGEKA